MRRPRLPLPAAVAVAVLVLVAASPAVADPLTPPPPATTPPPTAKVIDVDPAALFAAPPGPAVSTTQVDKHTKIVKRQVTIGGEVGYVEDGVTTLAITKGACRNSDWLHTSGARIEVGRCLESDGNSLRGKFRVTCFYGNDECLMNVGWDASPPHYRRVYHAFGYGGFQTDQRGPCLSCHTSVAYSTWGCPYPTGTMYAARMAYLSIRHSGTLEQMSGVYSSQDRSGCGPF
jgi:hypothetical protein